MTTIVSLQEANQSQSKTLERLPFQEEGSLNARRVSESKPEDELPGRVHLYSKAFFSLTATFGTYVLFEGGKVLIAKGRGECSQLGVALILTGGVVVGASAISHYHVHRLYQKLIKKH